MKRTRHYIFNTLTVVSMLLLLATLLLWVESYLYLNTLGYSARTENFSLSSSGGEWNIHMSRFSVELAPDPRPDYWYFNWRDPLANSPQPPGRFSDFNLLGFGMERDNYGAPVFLNATTELWLPQWLPALIFTILPAIWLIKWNKRRKLGPNACPACGYDLTGNESGVCPECGTESKAPDASGFHSV